ncbi:hypothetical protein BB559_006384 [Furculomyces boomerangus]|uniref:mRNA cap guanine-N(7) methyltransferase n=2 Tax=Harpellales TaxID=61421 RepID=A0A2T9Y3B4_9FUNG|nr:hypothetical protein BB559_007013 [Furculomyces boomerangus]PVU86821.1 hypothetical protein BB559_006384 [Furculomyces boomerangus]PVZ98432.1 hypothetical protein BB558_005566 [Smittium angustum]
MSPEIDKNISSIVAQHYNNRPNVDVDKRKGSVIIRLKSFNNWIKSILLANYTRPGDKFLDLGCGKGGDLLKLAKHSISELVGVDIAENSIEEATNRYNSLRNKSFSARFYTLDCFSNPISQVIQPYDFLANVVSMQFCFHYAFETEQKARQALKNVSDHLEIGGYFIGTTTNSYWLTKKLHSVPGKEFGNSVYHVRFEEKYSKKVFGRGYWFTLEDAIEDCPEYLIHFPTLQKLALEYNLELLVNSSFHDYYAQNISFPSNKALMRRMKVIDENGNGPSDDEWEAAGNKIKL